MLSSAEPALQSIRIFLVRAQLRASEMFSS